MAYKIKNKVGSPRLHLLNILSDKNIYSEFKKEGFVKIIEDKGYYFSQEILENNFDFKNSVHGVTSGEFMKITGYSRPKINTYIENHGRIVYLEPGYYDLSALRIFLLNHIKKWVEKRGRPKLKKNS